MENKRRLKKKFYIPNESKRPRGMRPVSGSACGRISQTRGDSTPKPVLI